MKGYGYNAFRYAMDNNKFDLPTSLGGLGDRSFIGVVNGKNIEGYYQIENGVNTIKTWWIK
ncbi:MAG: hypothetical protein ACK5QC_07640 [Bacteroidota bacterium]